RLSTLEDFELQTVQATLGISPAPVSFTIDGVSYSGTQTLTWYVGDAHTIATMSPQDGSAGTQYVFNNWSDGGAPSHSVIAPAAPATFTANFTTQYQLTTAAGPGGSVSPGAGNFYDA